MINCPNKSSKEFIELQNRVGEALANSIWHKTNGNVNSVGLPTRNINSLSEEEVREIEASRWRDAYNKSPEYRKPSDPNIKSLIFSGKSSSMVGDVLNNIIKVNPALAPIALSIKNVMQKNDLNVGIELKPVNFIPIEDDESEFINANGVYNDVDRKIEIAEFGDFQNSHNKVCHNCILHEIIHAITYNYIINNPESSVVEDLKKIYNHSLSEIASKYNVSDGEAKNMFYGLKSYTEFISEAFTKSLLISELMQIKSIGIERETNVFTQLFDWISSKIFGIKKNIYNDFLSVASDLMLRRKSLLDEVDFYSQSYSIQNFEEKQSVLQKEGWVRIDENNYYKQFFSDPSDLLDNVKDLGFSNIKISQRKNFNGRKTWIARISDGELDIQDIGVLHSISIEQINDIKNSDNDYIIKTSDNTILSTPEIDAAVGSILANFYDIMQNEGESVSVKKVLNYSYNSIAKAVNSHIDEYNKEGLSESEANGIEKNINSLNNILDKTAWKKLSDLALKKMQMMGVSVKNDIVVDEDNSYELISQADDEYQDEDDRVDSETGGLYGEDWNNNALMSTGDMDTSSRVVKMLMWSLRDPSSSVAGLAQMIDVEDAYRRVLNITSLTTDRTVDGIIESINNEAKMLDSIIPNNIFRQLYDKLKSADLQTRIQFATAMNRRRNMSIMNMWNPNYSTLSTFNSEVRRADKVVLGEWKSFIANALSRNSAIRQELLKKTSDKIAEAREIIKNNSKLSSKDLNNKLTPILKDALINIGIRLSDTTYSLLGDPKTYRKRDGYTFSGKASLSSQFSLTSSGKPNGIFSALEQALSKIKPSDSLESILESLDQSAFKFLANVESKTSKKYFANMSTGVDGNARYNFGINTSQTNIIHRLINDNAFVKSLQSSIFSGYSSWLKNTNLGGENTPMKNFLRIGYKDGIRKFGSNKSTARKAMVLSEDILSRLSDFQNNGKDTMLLWDTTKSDKHMQSIFELPRTSLDKGIIEEDKSGNVSINKEKLINSELLDDAFGIVRGECNRILAIMTMSSDEKNDIRNKYGIHYDNNGQFFYGYKFLNNIFKFNADLNMVPDAIVSINGTDVKTSDLLSLSNDSYIRFLKSKLADYFSDKVISDIRVWEDNGLITRDDKNALKSIPVNPEYAIRNNLGKWEYDPISEKRSFHYTNKQKALMNLALDMSLNSQVAIHNSMMIVSGDPAEIGKSTKDFINKAKKKFGADEGNLFIQFGIDDAMAEYQKRLAADIAPMINVAQNVKMSNGDIMPQQYNVIFTADVNTDGAEYLKSLSKSLKLKPEDLTSKGSDALEYVTVYNKLDSLFRYGAISESDYNSIKSKYSSGKDLSKSDLKKLIIGAGKPLQVSHKFIDVNGKKFYKKIYVKSAEMPLIRQMTQTLNSGLDGLRESMEKQNIDRVIHTSASKIGAENIISVYGEDGNFLDKNRLSDIFKNNVSQMEWNGFGYQQDLPYDEEHDDVRLVTQADATILEGVRDKIFNYKGENIDGETLLDRKNSIRTELSNLSESDLDSELGYSNNKFDEEKVLNTIEDNANRLKWLQNDVIAVRNTIRNKIPMLFSAISSKVESVLLSKYTNGVIKQRQPGGSFVQFPHLGKGIETLDADKINNINGVIKTKYYNPETGLQYYSSTKDGITLMDIMIPFKFWDSGKLLDVKNFVGEDGLLDLNKVPENLLKITGFRIPNQGHSSQVMCRIVGFLPEWYGDSAIVPPEITTQMGSDFDIDKLYSYWRNSFLSSSGSLSSIPSNVISFDDDNNIVVGYNKLAEWRYDTFQDKFENKKKFFNHLRNIAQLDNFGLSVLNEVSDMKDKSDGRQKNDINTFMDYELTFDDAKFMALEDLGLSESDVRIPSISSLAKHALEDSYFEIFDSVLSHPDVIKKALTPLDKPDLQQLSNEVKSLTPKDEYGDYMRQAEDYISQSGAKSGVGVFSKVVVGIARMENKDLHFVKVDENGKYVNDYFSKFKNNEGKTLNLYKLDPQTKSVFVDENGESLKRTGIDNIITQQTGAVDNANKPVLSKNNLNSKTFGVSALISAMSDSSGNGLALDTNARFLRQEGIRMLTSLIAESSGTIATYEESINRNVSNAAEEIENKLTDRYSGSKDELRRYLETLSDESYSPKELKDLEDMDDKNSLEYIGKQIDLVRTYKVLDGKAWTFSDATTLGTFDSKGLGASYYENEYMLYKATKVVRSGQVENASKIWSNEGTFDLGVVDGIYEHSIDPSDKITASGNNIRIAAKAQNAIGHLMGYNGEFLLNSIKQIEREKGLSGDSIYKSTAKSRKLISNSFKSFIYSRLPFLKDVSFQSLVDNKKLATDLLELKAEPELSSNLFIQTLQTSEDIKNVFMDAKTTDSSSATELVRGFYELATSDNQKYRDFADNIIKYELMIGGVQSPTSSLKYIPADILDRLGINKEISNALSGGISLSDMSEFVEKFFQNNPEEATFVRDLKKKVSSEKVTGKKRLFLNVNSKSNKYISNETFNKIMTVDSDGRATPKQFLRTSDFGKTRLYKFDSVVTTGDQSHEFVYDEIPLKGTASLSKGSRIRFTDYSGLHQSSLSQNLIANNDVAETIKPEVAPSKESWKRLSESIPHMSKLSEIKDALFSNDNPTFNWIGGIIESMSSKLKDVNIKYGESDTIASAQYDPKTKEITIFKKQISDIINSYGVEYAKQTLLHEINHAIMHEAYNLGKSGDPTFRDIYNNVNSIFEDVKSSIKGETVISITTGEEIKSDGTAIGYGSLHNLSIDDIKKFAKETFPNDVKLRNDYVLSMYSFINAEEFMADLMSRPKLQQFMSTVKISDELANKLSEQKEKSILRTLLDQFKKLFSRLNKISVVNQNGKEDSINSVLEAAFVNSMILVDKTKATDGNKNWIEYEINKFKSLIDGIGIKNLGKIIDRLSPNTLYIESKDQVGDTVYEFDSEKHQVNAIEEMITESEDTVYTDDDGNEFNHDHFVFSILDENSEDVVPEMDIDEFIKYITPEIVKIRPTFIDKTQMEIPFSISVESELPSTVAEFLRSSDKDVRFAFRNALSKGLFTTKCD